MDITLNKNWTIDELKEIIATKYPGVKKTSGYLKVNHNGIVLTVFPKKNNLYGINRDVPILKSILLAAAIVIVLGVIAAFVAPQLLGKGSVILILIGAFVFVAFQSAFKKKGESSVKEFCKELQEMTKKENGIKEKKKEKKEKKKQSSAEEPAKTESVKKKEENEQLAENGFNDEQPDAVTSNCKLYLEKKVLVVRNLDFPGYGTYRMGQRFSWARINLEDIVRVVDEEGSPGNVFTRTFYPESLKIETKDEVLHIGSTQHDYYEYMDPGSSFFIYTMEGQYEIDYDKKEVKTVWDWIVDYFNTKTKQDQTTTGTQQKQEVEVEKEEIKSPKEGSNDFVITKGDN